MARPIAKDDSAIVAAMDRSISPATMSSATAIAMTSRSDMLTVLSASA
jgi:hypothetical protein